MMTSFMALIFSIARLVEKLEKIDFNSSRILLPTLCIFKLSYSHFMPILKLLFTCYTSLFKIQKILFLK